MQLAVSVTLLNTRHTRLTAPAARQTADGLRVIGKRMMRRAHWATGSADAAAESVITLQHRPSVRPPKTPRATHAARNANAGGRSGDVFTVMQKNARKQLRRWRFNIIMSPNKQIWLFCLLSPDALSVYREWKLSNTKDAPQQCINVIL